MIKYVLSKKGNVSNNYRRDFQLENPKVQSEVSNGR